MPPSSLVLFFSHFCCHILRTLLFLSHIVGAERYKRTVYITNLALLFVTRARDDCGNRSRRNCLLQGQYLHPVREAQSSTIGKKKVDS